ncbi:maleylacetate reductase [Methylibium sp. Root1272]|uniref:maleylacetate reductase n=1 Tax=Methylibium sp. Root1272 TaxID=1736441 RepID=UPI0009EBFDD1|nr:maleylacetate reductase [Methylibium sp. Root1272]
MAGAPNAFQFDAKLPRVIFGFGSLAQLPVEVERIGAKRALVLCTPEQRDGAERVLQLLGARGAGIFDRAVMHIPIETARDATEHAKTLGADCAVAVGGGSTTGLGKAIALDSGLPIIAVPTTYAGSEMTAIFGITEGGIKKTGRDARVLPRSVLYDPELTLDLPLSLSVTSALNAIAHAAESLYARDGNPIICLMAEEAVRSLAQAVPRLMRTPRDLEARSQALYGAWLSGVVLGNSSMGLHHKLCHTLGGSFNLPHAEVHTVVLPHALAYNSAYALMAMTALGRALGVAPDAVPKTLQQLARSNGAPYTLREIGMPFDGLDRAADLAVEIPYPNPRPLQRGELLALLRRAYDGEMPKA